MILKTLEVGPFPTNCYIVGSKTTHEAMVIDPAAEADRILDEVKSLGLKVVIIVNTHGHGDHTGVVATVKEATGAPYALHEGDVPLLQHASHLRAMLPELRDPPQPDQLLRGGERVPVGDLSFLVLETPGHTPGSICLCGHGVVFTGDTLFQMSVGRTDSPGGSHAQMINNITAKLMILPEETMVLPGHGPSSTIGNERAMNPFLGGRGGLFGFR